MFFATDRPRIGAHRVGAALRDRKALQRLGLAAATCVALINFAPSAHADVIVDTTGPGTLWGTQTVPPSDPNFPGPTYHGYSYGSTTVGQAYTAPTGDNVLKNISFEVSAAQAFTYNYTAYTYAWDQSAGHPIGSALWTSGLQSIALNTFNTNTWNNYQTLTLNENLTLTPGQKYITLIVGQNGSYPNVPVWGTFAPTTTTPDPTNPNTLANTSFDWSWITSSNLNDITSLDWNNCGTACSFNGVHNVAQGAFKADFTSAVPEPSTWAMMMLGFAGLGLLAYRRNRRSGLNHRFA